MRASSKACDMRWILDDMTMGKDDASHKADGDDLQLCSAVD